MKTETPPSDAGAALSVDLPLPPPATQEPAGELAAQAPEAFDAEVVEPPSVALVAVESSGSLAQDHQAFGPADVLRNFLEGKTKNTLVNYQNDLRAFTKWRGFDSQKEALGDLLSMDGPHANALMLRWLAEMSKEVVGRGKPLSSGTQARRLSTFRSCTKVARLLGLITWTLEIEGPKVEAYRDTRGPSIEEVQAMMLACSNHRDRALVHLTASLGLRRVEICQLNREDYDRERRQLSVLGKGNKTFVFTVPTVAVEYLNTLIDTDKIIDPKAPIFQPVNRPGQRLSTNGVYEIVERIGKNAGLTAHPHGLRHMAITTGLDEADGDVRRVRRFSRHAKVETVMVYDDSRRDDAGEIAELVSNRLAGRKKEGE